MIYPSDSSSARLAAAQALAETIRDSGASVLALVFSFLWGSEDDVPTTAGDPVFTILDEGHIRDADILFVQRTARPFSPSFKLANAMIKMSMLDRARVVLPEGTDAEISALLDREGTRP